MRTLEHRMGLEVFLEEVLIVHSVGTCQVGVFNQNCEPAI